MTKPATVGRWRDRQANWGSGTTRRSPLHVAVLLVAALAAVWSLVSPLGSIPDESAHVVNAAAVVRGEFGGGESGRSVSVPVSVAQAVAAECVKFRPPVTADCIPDIGAEGHALVRVEGALDYPPLYYALVGWPTLFSFGEATWYLMRLLSVALGALLLLIGAMTWRCPTIIVTAGVIVAVNPMASFVLGSVNPNGPEIAAGVALMLAGTGIVFRSHRSWSVRDAVAIAVPAAYLSVARPSSYVLTVALLGVLSIVALPQLVATARRRPRAMGSGVLLLLVLLLVARIRSTAQPTLARGDGGMSWQDALSRSLLYGFDIYLETGGVLGWRDHFPPIQLRLLPVGLALALVVGGWFAVRAPRERVALLVLLIGALYVGPFFAFLTVFRDGIGYQGRYGMALTQALPVLGAALIAARWANSLGAIPRRVIGSVPVVMVLTHFLVLGGSWLRYAVGLPVPVDPRVLGVVEWVPPSWPVLIAVAGVTVTLTLRLRALMIDEEEQLHPDPGDRVTVAPPRDPQV